MFGKTIMRCCIAVTAMSVVSCNSFLDIVPDDIATVDHAFTNAKEAEKFLFTCYSYLPQSGNPGGNFGLTAGDEIWMPDRKRVAAPAWDYVARGEITPELVRPNFWSGSDYALPMYTAIHDCNTFISKLEDLSMVPDLGRDQRARWIAEAKFLKAFYHFHLLRLYGPIPILDEVIPTSADPKDVQVKREPIDVCVKYISDLLDECYSDLPLVISSTYSELGRITKPINRALKAKLLLMAASPLFNCNTDYANFTDQDGTLFFNQDESLREKKWAAAAEAAKEAIDVAHSAGHKLYEFVNDEPGFTFSKRESITQMSIRQAVCERWNSEIIWGLSGSGRASNPIQQACIPKLDASFSDEKCRGSMAPPLHVIKQFYSKNGVPITEDKTLDFSNPEALRVATADDIANMETGYTTARINFDREPRFYACVGFDGGKWLMSSHPNRSDVGNYVVKSKFGQISYGAVEGSYSMTGYFIKKLVNWKSQFTSSTTGVEYSWPEIRLADIYLMYVEALNELEGPNGENSGDLFFYIDEVRSRAGLDGVRKSWTEFSTNPAKLTTKEGMRDIIQRERLNELAFEGSRYFDLLRWKLAESYLDTPITGWDVKQDDATAYYKTKTITYRQFIAPRDYFLPIQNSELLVNPRLVQNPGW